MKDRTRWLLACVAGAVATERIISLAVAAEIERKPSIADYQPETLWDFLAAFPSSFEAQQFVGLMIAGTIGYLAHYSLKWARNEIRENFFSYFINNFRSTMLSFFTYVGVSAGAIVGDAFIGDHGGFVGWKVLFWMGITNGFTIDAIVNKTQRAEWTPQEKQRRYR